LLPSPGKSRETFTTSEKMYAKVVEEKTK